MLKTNATDTLILKEAFGMEDGAEGVRTLKVIGGKFPLRLHQLDVHPQYLAGGLQKFQDTVTNKVRQLFKGSGAVTIKFVIGYNGKPSKLQFIDSAHPDTNTKLSRFIKSLPRWAPGIRNNKYALTQFELYISELQSLIN
jgi:hypothetical protein